MDLNGIRISVKMSVLRELFPRDWFTMLINTRKIEALVQHRFNKIVFLHLGKITKYFNDSLIKTDKLS